MAKRQPISIGTRFTRYVVLDHAGYGHYSCLCDCGTRKTVKGTHLRQGTVLSCGCLHHERLSKRVTKHGHARTGGQSPVYRVYTKMVARCFDPAHTSYPNYGGRGITVCEEWRRSFSAFYAYVGDRPDGMSIDRIDNNRGYEPGNVRWATRREQSRNRRCVRYLTINGVTHSAIEWAEISGVPLNSVSHWNQRGRPSARLLRRIQEMKL